MSYFNQTASMRISISERQVSKLADRAMDKLKRKLVKRARENNQFERISNAQFRNWVRGIK